MRNPGFSKLVYFLSAFEASDRKQFRDFLDSPVFNKQEEPRLLFTYIEKNCLKKEIQEIDDAKAKSFIWKKKNVGSNKLNKIKTALLNLCLEYLEFRNWQKQPEKKKIGLLEELNLLEDQSYFDQYYRKAFQSLEKSRDKNLGMYSIRLEMESQQLVFRQLHESRSEKNHLLATIDALEKHVLAYVLKYAYAAINQSRIIGLQDLPDWIRDFASQVRWEQVQGEPLLEIYFLLYQTRLPGEHSQKISELKSLILEHSSDFAPDEANDLYTGALNNISRQRQMAGKDLLQEIFDLYESMVEVYAKEKGKGLVPWHFKNIVSIAARLKRFEWVEEFLTQGPQLLALDEEAMQRAIDYNRGVLSFYKGEFKQAEKYLHQILPGAKDIFYASDARAYLLMCYYENGDSIGMESLVHSFRMFLSRSDRVSESHRESYLEFMRVFRRVLATPPQDDVRLQLLKTDIDQLKFSVGKSWLLEKVSQLGA